MIIREGGTTQTNIQLKPELLAADLWVAGWGGIIQTDIRATLSLGFELKNLNTIRILQDILLRSDITE